MEPPRRDQPTRARRLLAAAAAAAAAGWGLSLVAQPVAEKSHSAAAAGSGGASAAAQAESRGSTLRKLPPSSAKLGAKIQERPPVTSGSASGSPATSRQS